MLPEPKKRYPLILDVGCGRGNSFELLEKYFNPDHINGIEVDESLLGDAQKQAEGRRCSVDLLTGNAAAMPYPDQSFDMVFCHAFSPHRAARKNDAGVLSGT